ncbi:MAG: peptide chain release factor N(5)-glutamine methyltransferase [Candidatus Falkowbacteria bacterium]
MTINKILKKYTHKLESENIPNPQIDAEILLSYILKKPCEFLLTHPEKKLSKLLIASYSLLVTQRLKNIPIAYITKTKSFYGLDFYVNKNVLIPRPETELIIEEVLKTKTNATIIDVGTGSGCIIITLAKLLENKKNKFFAIDISKKALSVARKNAKLNNVNKKIKFLHGNLLEPILKNPKYLKYLNNPKNPIIITANLPYLTSTQIKNSPSIQSEPKMALVAGNDGLKYYKIFFKQLNKLNNKNLDIKILCEIDPSQTIKIKKLIKKELPKNKIQIKKDLRGQNRLIIIKSLIN